MATYSSILAWRIPWTEEPGGLQSLGSQRVGHDWATEHTHKEEFKGGSPVHVSGRGFLWWSHFKRKGTKHLRKTSGRKDEQADAEKKQRSAVPQVLSDSRDGQQGFLNVMCPQVVTPCGGCGGGRWNSPPRCWCAGFQALPSSGCH